jgi:hypothetical protein
MEGQDQAGGSQVEEEQVQALPSSVAGSQAAMSESEAQLKMGSDVQVDALIIEPSVDEAAGKTRADPEEVLETTESQGGKLEGPSIVASAEAEPEELTRAGEALERVRDQVAGRLQLSDLATPKRKVTIKMRKRPGSEIAEGSAKKARVESSSIQQLASPPPATESVPAEGM